MFFLFLALKLKNGKNLRDSMIAYSGLFCGFIIKEFENYLYFIHTKNPLEFVLKYRVFQVVIGAPFIGHCSLKNSLFSERLAHNLKADRKFGRGEPARLANSG